MDTHHENTINFGEEEANRMALLSTDKCWAEAEKWLRTTTGQEFCDELVWGTVEANGEAIGSLLRSFGIPVTSDNRSKFLKLADKLMSEGEA